jgi:hypothetical protein
MIDLQGTPTHVCICGSKIWNIKAMFENGAIALYFLDMNCAECGSLATAPTKLDGGEV